MFISCASTVVLASPSYCTWKTNMTGFKKQLYSTQPITMATTTKSPIVRRSGNYPPSQWSYDYLQSLTNNYLGEKYKTTSHSLKERVRTMFSKYINVLEKPIISALELVDDLQRLGISYHFKDEISNVLKMVYNCYYKDQEKWTTLDLNLKALGFRLLRQHGYGIPQEIFEDIKDATGKIKTRVREDVVGLLNLYEASFFAIDGENILDEAREFTSKCLKEKLENNLISNRSMVMLISHALELPLNWRIPRFEAMWFIETYSGRSDMRPLLLELAKLDFNIVQGIHREDLRYLSRWWDGLGWDKKLSFARDRLVVSFMWAVAANSELPSGAMRRLVTKSICLVTVIDDVYDLYGTLDELELFTDIVRRWDINELEGLPYYMKTCFLGFYNTINDLTYDTLKNQESLVLPYVKKAWTEYCEANLLEARWFNDGYTPTLEEYLNNSCITISLPAIVASAYIFATSSDITEKSLKNIVHWSAMILRLADDLGTSTEELKRGDVPKSIQCYMHETGAAEEEARDHIKRLIIETWKKLIKERMIFKFPSSWIFVECATNLGRMAQFTYQRGDGFGSPDDLYKSHAMSLLFNPKN